MVEWNVGSVEWSSHDWETVCSEKGKERYTCSTCKASGKVDSVGRWVDLTWKRCSEYMMDKACL